jgi:hypothetical protein
MLVFYTHSHQGQHQQQMSTADQNSQPNIHIVSMHILLEAPQEQDKKITASH